MQVTVHNRGPDDAELHVLPTLWFRHTWSWAGGADRPSLHAVADRADRAPSGLEHAELGTAVAVRRQATCRCWSPGTRPTTSGCSARPTTTPYVKDGIDRSVVARRHRGGEPERVRDQGRLALRADGPGRRQRHAAAAADATPSSRRTSASTAGPFADFDERDERPARRGRRVLGRPADRTIERRTSAWSSARRWPGMLWSKQYYALDVERWLAEHGADPLDAGTQAAQPRLAPLRRRGRHLDAGQVGVPLVRRLGPRLPRRGARGGRHGVRQAAARTAAEPALPAPERAAAGVRVELQRRQPAGARLGDAASSTSSKRPGPARATARSSRAPSRS